MVRHLLQAFQFPRRWASVSGVTFTEDEWKKAWPARTRGSIAMIWKSSSEAPAATSSPARSTSAGARSLSSPHARAGRAIGTINEIGRGSRARRAWYKAWHLVARNLPTAWPMLMMERRTLGYVTDSIFICQRVAGETLASVDLESMPREERDSLFRRTGRILRRIEQYGFSHFDAKASNWIVEEDPELGPTPVLIDVDGVRRRKWTALGIRRLLRAMPRSPAVHAGWIRWALVPGDMPPIPKSSCPRRIRKHVPRNAVEWIGRILAEHLADCSCHRTHVSSRQRRGEDQFLARMSGQSFQTIAS